MIEVVHSKWGVVKLSMKMNVRYHKPTCKCGDHSEGFSSIIFSYPSGNFMGEWDSDQGGGLAHPNEVIAKFMMSNSLYLLDVDEVGYLELEDLLEKEVRRIWPDFLNSRE